VPVYDLPAIDSDLAFGSGKWRGAAIGPGVHLGAIVGGEHGDRVLIETIFLEPIQDNANVVVQLLHRRFFQAESPPPGCAWRRTSATDESARVRALDSSSLLRSRDPHEVLTERNFMETSLRYTANAGLQTPNVKGNLPYADSNDRGSRP
jgi:hypothetical protein